MGKITSEPQQTTATHFSHPHPLKLINFHQTPTTSPSCSACKLKPSGTIYSCTVCNYFLHKKCFEMPKKITHPFHKHHAFTLLPEPAYAEGVFNCDACRETGTGFSYHCKPCGIDLHILCAAAPLSVTTAYHLHKLDLAFVSPYDTKNFFCDVCKGPGLDHWLYRCSSCGFDAHLKCARGAPPVVDFHPPGQQAATCSRSAPVAQHHGARPAPVAQPQGGGGGLHFMAATPSPVQQNFVSPHMVNNSAVGVPAGAPVLSPFAVNRHNEMALQAIMQMIQNNNALTQAILEARLGGGGGGLGGVGGANGGLQQLMQLTSGLNNSGFGGGGGSLGGVGGGNGGLQQLMQLMSGVNNSGFGGGGIPGLDAFGGGGLDSLQSLLGGGGGLDFLGALGGLF